MKVYNPTFRTSKGFKGQPLEEGESIEQKIERIVENGEPIEDGAPLIYDEDDDVVDITHDIRTDRWEVALEAMDKAYGPQKPAASDIPKSDAKPEIPEQEKKLKEE